MRPPMMVNWLVFFILFGLQAALWSETKQHRPKMEVVPAVPGELAVKAVSLGDSEFLFRLLGLHLQNFGDTFGRFTALREYNFERLSGWFKLLDQLNDTSDYIPTLASYYFSQTQNTPDVSYVVDYLQIHAEHRINEKWWWQAQAVYLANHKLHNSQLALQLSKPLLYAQDVPLWVNQLPAFIYESRGEFDAALSIMEHIKDNVEDIKPGELNFIQHFIEERIGAIEKSQKEIEAID